MNRTAYEAYEERPLGGTGKYNLDDFLHDDLEIEDNFSDGEEATLDQSILASVRVAYGQVLHQATTEFTKQTSFAREEEEGIGRGKQEIIAQRQT